MPPDSSPTTDDGSRRLQELASENESLVRRVQEAERALRLIVQATEGPLPSGLARLTVKGLALAVVGGDVQEQETTTDVPEETYEEQQVRLMLKHTKPTDRFRDDPEGRRSGGDS